MLLIRVALDLKASQEEIKMAEDKCNRGSGAETARRG